MLDAVGHSKCLRPITARTVLEEISDWFFFFFLSFCWNYNVVCSHYYFKCFSYVFFLSNTVLDCLCINSIIDSLIKCLNTKYHFVIHMHRLYFILSSVPSSIFCRFGTCIVFIYSILWFTGTVAFTSSQRKYLKWLWTMFFQSKSFQRDKHQSKTVRNSVYLCRRNQYSLLIWFYRLKLFSFMYSYIVRCTQIWYDSIEL